MVYQWCRGTSGSEGQWEPNVHERDDGLSLVGWLQKQPWVESMGYYGNSYLALTGWAMADAVPEKMKTMYLAVYGTVRHASAWQDGLFRQDILTAWAMGNAGHKVEADYLESARFRPHTEVDEALWGGKLSWYRDWITHPDGNDAYWQEGFWALLKSIPSKIKIPIFVAEGWYDHHLGSSLKGWETLSETAKAHSVLQICPGNHIFMPAIYGHPEAKHAEAPQLKQALQWFDQILRRHELPKPEVQIYEVGMDKWHSLPSYPFPVTREKVFYLSDHALTENPEASGTREYDYDPENPVQTHGAESLFISFAHTGSREQPAPDWRDDVLSFLSAPQQRPVRICGSIRVKLFVRSDAPDTCFAVKLSEVFPDGRAFHIRNAITTLGWHKGRRRTYNGGVAELELETWPIAWKMRPGSRLRLDVTSSNFPEYSIHPNTLELWSEATETRTAHQTIFYGEDHPACVILPE